jgi:hypothetical protein
MNNKTPEAVKTLRNKGLSFKAIADILDIGETTARYWYYDISRAKNNPIGYVNQNLSRNLPNKSSKEDVFEFLENLKPLNYVSKRKEAKVQDLNDYCVIIGDIHFPTQHQPTINIFFETIRELKPKTIIINGDSLDMFSISRYPKDIRQNYSLLDERLEYHNFLSELIEISNGAKIIETNANHSGNDMSGRWFRYLSDRIGELACLPDVIDKLSYQNVFLGQYQNIVDLVDYVELTPNLIVLHGDIVRKNGGFSAFAHMEKWMVSIIHNHTHRFGSTSKRIPSIGSRKDSQIYAWENACACDLSPVYGSAPNWQNGFSIVCLDGNDYGIEQVKVENNRATISTLGRTYIS